jgi:hypothetical protein
LHSGEFFGTKEVKSRYFNYMKNKVFTLRRDKSARAHRRAFDVERRSAMFLERQRPQCHNIK